MMNDQYKIYYKLRNGTIISVRNDDNGFFVTWNGQAVYIDNDGNPQGHNGVYEGLKVYKGQQARQFEQKVQNVISNKGNLSIISQCPLRTIIRNESTLMEKVGVGKWKVTRGNPSVTRPMPEKKIISFLQRQNNSQIQIPKHDGTTESNSVSLEYLPNGTVQTFDEYFGDTIKYNQPTEYHKLLADKMSEENIAELGTNLTSYVVNYGDGIHQKLGCSLKDGIKMASAIHSFTGGTGVYVGGNTIVNGSRQYSKIEQANADYIEKFIELSKPYEGYIYRGLKLNENTVKNFAVGKDIITETPTSWSAERATAERFSGGYVPVVMRARDIRRSAEVDMISANGGESEVIVGNKTKLHICDSKMIDGILYLDTVEVQD